MCASVNRNKPRVGSRNSSRRSSISSTRSVRSTRGEELGKLLNERTRHSQIAAFNKDNPPKHMNLRENMNLQMNLPKEINVPKQMNLPKELNVRENVRENVQRTPRGLKEPMRKPVDKPLGAQKTVKKLKKPSLFSRLLNKVKSLIH
ncbi:hypothetical protein TpMuguga_01g00555 [Theileria parva strain Muguga]|uniref:Uncharacterized protein n=1 Tax=Theileria parva TaxID=5875 RepID=Q4N8B7_THEPA|nr:uncharacterized protein TpMuguga_01g00555 [Theileria parva strain Muguga]EAN33791.1 hypothetical protein TpMuguga_01g00555 [Theileria parva strain Muguga]|eukprot:XP_766074.1 hypothetical protein [Theileria parva strain Muguga]